MTIGDSMTAGSECDGAVPTYHSYRASLRQQLANAGYSVDFIGSRSCGPAGMPDPQHEGYGGRLVGPDNLGVRDDTIYDLVVGNARFASILGPASDPDIVILALGWNSANYRADDAANQYELLAAKVRELKPRAAIVVATLSPRESELATPEGLTPIGYRTLNAKARTLAGASAGENVHLADLAAAGFTSSDYIAPGEIHWSRTGAERAAGVIFQSLVAARLLDGTPN